MPQDIEDINKITCPETVPEDQKGMTQEEEEWALKSDPRPPVPRSIFVIIAAIAVIAFLGGSFWYYRTNVLPEKYYQQASLLFKQERFTEAYTLYEKVLKLRPERKGVLYQMAFCLEKTGRSNEAITRYEEHLKLLPSDGKAMIRAGWLYAGKGNSEKGLALLKRGASILKDPYAWALLGDVAAKTGDRDSAVEALIKQIELFKEPEQILTCSKMLMRYGAWEEALKGFKRFTKMTPDDRRGLHGENAAKIMLGYPTDHKFVIVPGKSIGEIRLDFSKEEVKSKIGGPDSKEFIKIGGNSASAGIDAEIWSYGVGMPGAGLRVIFTDGKVREVEVRSAEYKTENGLGISNFLLEKNADKLEARRDSGSGTVLCAVRGGGLTFYAAGLNEKKTDAKYKKLRLHKGSSPIDGKNGFSLMNLIG